MIRLVFLRQKKKKMHFKNKPSNRSDPFKIPIVKQANPLYQFVNVGFLIAYE